MLQQIFTIYDDKAKAFLPPWTLPEVGMAIRTFSDCVNSKDHQFSTHPADYTLFHLGTFDDNTAIINYFEAINNLGTGITFKKASTSLAQTELELVEKEA